MITPERQSMRQTFFATWQKLQEGTPLFGVELPLAEIIQQHPEYHQILAKPNQYLTFDFADDSENPFLHMSLHLAVLEQVTTNRPEGIRAIYETLCQLHQNEMAAQHSMMSVLNEMMQEFHAEDPQINDVYMQRLRRLL